jgi:hypothetical protein
LGAGLLLAGALLVLSAQRYGAQPPLAMQPAQPPVPQRPVETTSIFETWKKSRFGR